jgi:mono/diheme cytochrome c family protein
VIPPSPRRGRTFAAPASLALIGVAVLALGRAEADDGAKEVRSFLDHHCARCHGAAKPKGNFRVDTLGDNFTEARTAARWAEVVDRLHAGEMPPPGEPRPNAEQATRVADRIAARLAEAEGARRADSGERVAFRRLSREEYRNTIRDLLGVTYDASDPSGLPEDPDWQGFERIGSVLTLSAAHVEKYLAAAESVLNEALALGPRPPKGVTRWTAAEMRVRGDIAEELAARGLLDKVRADIVPNNGFLDGRELTIATQGEYAVRVKLSGLRPGGGRAARLRLYATDLDRTLFERDVDAPEDAPTVLEFRTHLPVGTHLIRIVNAVPGPNPEERASRPLNTRPFFRLSGRQPWQIKLTDDDGKPLWPTILLDWVEWEGPLQESWPTPAHRRIFFAGEGATTDAAYAREILSRFAGRAYRRPVRPAELDRLVQLFERSRGLGDGFEASVKTALVAVLCSDSFLYLIEGSPAAPSARLTDPELASRLSYFLWSSMPDDRLVERAGRGVLHEPETLRAEFRRMLADPKAEAFAQSFPRQWLQLRRVGMFAPDRKLYPEYDEYLEKSMVAETVAFFGEMLARDLPVREFLASDWTMLNEILARHYGIAGVEGEAMRRVPLRAGDHRGGVLTQASVLGLTSDGTRHRPVHRGKWVLESIYGAPPPPPPPNVTAIRPSPPDRPKTSLRAKIEEHRREPNCAGCHRRIDPLGLAFEQFDAIGRFRTVEEVRDGSGANPAVDPGGELPDGRRFADADGLKALMVDDLDRFASALAGKLATYALRRGMTIEDRNALAGIVARSKRQGYGLASLVEALVLSDLFQRR